MRTGPRGAADESIRLMALAWRIDRARISATDRLVLLRLCDRAADDGSRVYPAVESVADDCSLTRRSVQCALSRLRAAGLLLIVGGGKGGRRNPTRYCIAVDRLTALANRANGARYSGEKGATVAPCPKNETAHVVPETAQVVRDNRARGAPEPSFNHQGPQPPSASAPQRGQACKLRSRFPEGFELTAERVKAARDAIKRAHKRTPGDAWLRRPFDIFGDEFRSRCGPSAYRSDWLQAWVRWAVKAVEYARPDALRDETPLIAPNGASA